jgi:hypothetical protein
MVSSANPGGRQPELSLATRRPSGDRATALPNVLAPWAATRPTPSGLAWTSCPPRLTPNNVAPAGAHHHAVMPVPRGECGVPPLTETTAGLAPGSAAECA